MTRCAAPRGLRSEQPGGRDLGPRRHGTSRCSVREPTGSRHHRGGEHEDKRGGSGREQLVDSLAGERQSGSAGVKRPASGTSGSSRFSTSSIQAHSPTNVPTWLRTRAPTPRPTVAQSAAATVPASTISRISSRTTSVTRRSPRLASAARRSGLGAVQPQRGRPRRLRPGRPSSPRSVQQAPGARLLARRRARRRLRRARARRSRLRCWPCRGRAFPRW